MHTGVKNHLRSTLICNAEKEKQHMAKELAKTYDPKGIEDKIYEKWLEKKYFHAEVDRSKSLSQ